MTLRAESIMAAVQAAVTGLATTGARVDRGRGDDIPEQNTPALRVAMGGDDLINPYLPSLIDSDLEVIVTAYAYDSANNIESKLNAIRAEVVPALLAGNRTLGLGYVHIILEVGAKEPDYSGDMAKPAGKMEMNFKVRYRRSATDPSA